jgi:hypothetical protein
MIRWLLIALFIYLVIRIIRGPKNQRKPFIRFHFNNAQNGFRGNRTDSGRRKRRLDEIEEAEYEDITDNLKEEEKNS